MTLLTKHQANLKDYIHKPHDISQASVAFLLSQFSWHLDSPCDNLEDEGLSKNRFSVRSFAVSNNDDLFERSFPW